MLNTPDPLQDLRDVHLPDPISWWPPALGWWMIFAVLIIGFGLMAWVWVYRQRTRYRRVAMAKLQEVKRQYAANPDDHWAIREVSHLVRRVALATFPRSQVAGLTGQSWLQFLDATGHTDQFSNGPGLTLCSGPYQAGGSSSAAELFPLIENWLQQITVPLRKPMR